MFCRIAPLLLATLMPVALAAACSAGQTNAVFRPYQGGVTVVHGGNKESLTLESGYPKLELSSRFLLRLRGQHQGQQGSTTHDLMVLLDPIREPPTRYDFPRDTQLLQLSRSLDGVVQNNGNTGGFLQIGARDGTEGSGGNAVVSMTFTDGGNQPVLEVDLVFGPL